MTLTPLAQAAKRIRAAIGEAGAGQDLPPHPPQVTIRVRCSHSSQAEAIDIYVENVPHAWLIEVGAMNLRTEASLLLESHLREIAGRYFEADNRESFVHVQFKTTEGES